MSLQYSDFEAAKKNFKGLSRKTSMKRRIKSSAIPYGTNSVSRKKAKKKRLSDKQLKKKVWAQFSIFIRTRGADESGYVQCTTCPAIYLWNSGEIHAGHWIHNRLDYEPRNVHPQCVRCNYHWNTQVNVAYSIFMAKTYGIEVMEELKLLSHTKGNRYLRSELLELLEKYRSANAENPLIQVER